MPEIINNKKELEDILIKNQKVLVDFYADWCAPCNMLSPVLEEIESENLIKICKINVDNNQELVSEFLINSIPTLIYFFDSQVKTKITGLKSKQDILKLIS